MHKEFIQKLNILVEANLANETFGPDDLAREAGMSHTHLNRKLKSITNQNASQFIREIRLIKAKELLTNEDLTVAEISYRVGFSSPAYFNRCFHEYFGKSPGELRNNLAENDPVEQSVEPLPTKRIRIKMLIGISVGLLILVPFSFFLIKKITYSREKSIAVIPFINDSPDSINVYFNNGVIDAITVKLSQINDLKVTSRTSVERYRNNKTKSILQIARELKVRYILEGSSQKIGDSVLVSVQLIEAHKDKHILSQQYSGKYENLFNLYSEIAFDVAAKIKALVTPEEKQLIRKTPTKNQNAYNFYQRGKDQFDNYNDPKSLENARRLFQKALTLDSTFAQAWSGLAGVYLVRNYWKTFLSENFMDSVLILTNKALAYDNQCAEAYYFRGRRFYELGMLPECLKEFDKAIKLNPDYWKIYNHRSSVRQEGSRDFTGAISDMNEAIKRSSVEMLPNLLTDLGMAYISIGFPEKVKQYWQLSLELFGDSSVYLYWMMQAAYCEGNYEKAYQTAQRAYQLDSIRINVVMPFLCLMTGRIKEAGPYLENAAKWMKMSGENYPGASQGVGYYYWMTGRKKEAEYFFNKEIELELESIRLGRSITINRQAHLNLAKTYAFLGDREKAYLYLDEVNKNKSFSLWEVNEFKDIPLFSPIRREPRFQKILKEVEAKYQAEHERVRKWLVSRSEL